jgi:hypothetical protein
MQSTSQAVSSLLKMVSLMHRETSAAGRAEVGIVVPQLGLGGAGGTMKGETEAQTGRGGM